MDERKKMEACRMAEYVLISKSKYAGELWRHLKFYNDNLDKAPPLQDEKLADSPLSNLKMLRRELEESMQKLEKMCRKLYEKQTGQKWQPSLTVVPDCGKTKASKRQGRPRQPTLTVILGGKA